MASKKKLLTSGVAVVSAAAILFGGTFAWQSISQTALNEVSASANPGGRLHDDFHNVTGEATAQDGGSGPILLTYDKDVYVENFTDYAENGTRIFARIRLDEYMEVGDGAGVTDPTQNHAVSLVKGAKLSDKSTWTPLTMEKIEDGTSPFAKYWAYTTGGQTTFMPTFNKNKDSLEADINGSFAANFADYVDYSNADNREKSGFAIYDLDDEGYGTDGLKIAEKDELAEALKEKNGDMKEIIYAAGESDATGYINYLDESLLADRHITVKPETHTVAETDTAKLMSIAEWNSKVDVNGYTEDLYGYWVYDTDGWFYWSEPINPESSTGLLLDQIQRTENTIDRDWYYGLNVVAQFVTADDVGRRDNTGFYTEGAGSAPSAEALKLLETIGVDVSATEVATADDLAAALEEGGIVTLTDDIQLTEQLNVTTSSVLNLDGHTISGENIQDWGDAKVWSLISVRDGATLTINSGRFETTVTHDKELKDSYCVDVRDGSRVVINGGEFIGNVSAVYVYEGEAFINGGAFSIREQNSNEAQNKFILNCYDGNWENGTAGITVTGGSFKDFDPSVATEDPSVNGGKYLAAGYESNGSDGWYTVTKAGSSTGA